jgi:hypothetical protein
VFSFAPNFWDLIWKWCQIRFQFLWLQYIYVNQYAYLNVLQFQFLWICSIRKIQQKLKNCRKYGSYWLIIYCLTSRSRIFHIHGDVTITGEGLQNLGLCLALRAFEQGGIFIVPHLLWHGASDFPVSSKGPPHAVASYDTQGDVENLF